MKKKVFIFLSFMVCIFLFSCIVDAHNDAINYTNSNLLVTLDDDFSLYGGEISNTVIDALEDIGAKDIENVFHLDDSASTNGEYNQILKVRLSNNDQQNIKDKMDIISELNFVKFIEEDSNIEASSIPNEPYQDKLWNMGSDGVNAYEAWDIEPSSNSIRVGIMDSGIADHEDLVVEEGYDFYNENSITSDDESGHGTHIAGVIAAKINNIGVSGVAPNVKIVPLQISYMVDEDLIPWTYTSTVIKAISYATNLWDTPDRIDILNYSFEGYGENLTVLNAAKNFPGLFVWCAGNDRKDLGMIEGIEDYQADNIITVASHTENGTLGTNSNSGYFVDVLAPGQSIYSTLPLEINSTGYGYMSGTSMAAPHVSAIAALILSYDRDIPSSMVKEIICNNCKQLPNLTNRTRYGVVDAYKVMQYVEDKIIDYYFIVDKIFYDSVIPITISKPVLNLYDNYEYTAPDTMTSTNSLGDSETRGFTSWQMRLNGSYDDDLENNPWITISTEKTFSIFVYDLITNYYPDYTTVDNIYIRAIYSTSIDDGSGSGGTCLAEGTKVRLKNGSEVSVEDLTSTDELLIWNFETGSFDYAPILFIDFDETQLYEVINLHFSNDSIVKVVGEHGFFDINLNKYVYLDKNAHNYIGHYFAANDEQDSLEQVRLDSVSITYEQVKVYSPITSKHYCYFVEDMLSVPGGMQGLLNIFEVQDFKYDENLKMKDISEYELYSYEEFISNVAYVSKDIFENFNGKYLKIAIGKSLISIEELRELIAEYSDLLTEV